MVDLLNGLMVKWESCIRYPLFVIRYSYIR